MSSHVVYRYVGSKGEALYIGYTGNLERRQQSHSQKYWWPEVVKTVVRHVPEGEMESRRIEAIQIHIHKPKYNRIRYVGKHHEKVLTSPDFAVYCEHMTSTERKEFRRKTGLSKAQLSQYIHGARDIGVDAAIRIMVASDYELTLEQLRPDLYKKARWLCKHHKQEAA